MSESARLSRIGRHSNADSELNLLALVKGEEHFVFLYPDGCESEALRSLGRFAADPDLDFTWYDAATLSRKIREAAQ